MTSLLQRILSPLRHSMRLGVNKLHRLSLQDIEGELQRRALNETADYVEQNLSAVDSVNSQFRLLTAALNEVTDHEGLYLEFGVYSGTTINHIAKHTKNPVYGFDSFEGLPERWRDRYASGRFKVDSLPQVRANVSLIKGWFDQTLPLFLREQPGGVAFLHIDCDLYSSTKTILTALKSRIRENTIIVFDEYFNYPGWKLGEYKAFQEFLAEESWDYDYISYNRYNEQVCIKIKKNL